MKSVLFLLLALSTAIQAGDSLLKCLGQEEALFFKRRAQGSLVKLNQDLIAEFVQFPSFQPLKSHYFDSICQSQVNSPSFALLKTSLENRENIFKRPQAKEVEHYLLRVPDFFLSLIAQIRTYTADSECLARLIPELRELDETVISFRGEKSGDLLFYKNPLVHTIMAKLPNTLAKLDQCQPKRQDPPSESQNPQQ